MKIPVALTMLASPFSLPHNERWILPIALGFFALLTVYFTWRLKTDEGRQVALSEENEGVGALSGLHAKCSGSSTVRIRRFPSGRSRAILFLYLMSQALVYGIYCVIQKKKTTAAM